MTLRVFLGNLGLGLPGRSTLTELVNAVSSATREKFSMSSCSWCWAKDGMTSRS